jgi:hypothetical protein
LGVIKQIKELKSFSTGLDIFYNAESGESIIYKVLKSINVFSILGFYFICSQLNKLKKNNIAIISCLVVLFVIISTVFDSIELSNLLVWNN